MNTRFIPALAAFSLVFMIPACGEDGPPTGGGKQDTTPPAITSITAIDAYHIQVVFNEALSRSAAEGSYHYWIEETAPPPVHGAAAALEDPLIVGGATLADDEKTVSLSTYSPMTDIAYDLTIWGLEDAFGNVVGNVIEGVTQSFVGNAAADETPPQVVSRTPAPNAVDIPVGVAVAVKFSESISVENATWISDGEIVLAEPWVRGDKLTMSPDHALAPGSENTVTLSGVQDLSGNVMPDIQWSFTVTTVQDNTPPRLISSVPANFANNVSVNSNISLTFSEPLHPDTRFVTIIPYLDVFLIGFLDNDGRTLVVETGGLLKANQQYTVWLEPSYFRDLSGNSLNQATTVTFTTGRTLFSGRIAGKLTGDPGTGAADPAGASVIAEGDSNLVAVAAAKDGTFKLNHLPDYLYRVTAVKESNNDGNLDFYFGDAIGLYGVNLALQDLEPDFVEITSGAQVTGINFAIYDPSAVWGTLSYSGIYQGENNLEYVGLFKTEGFDPHNPSQALLVADTGAYLSDPWSLNSLIQEFPEGDYYVAAYIDVGNYGLDVSVDPYNWYGGPGAPIVVHLVNGSDVADIKIALSDPAPGLTSVGHSIPWRATKENATFKHLGDMVRKSQRLVK